MFKNSDNSLVMQLKQQLTELQHAITSLQAEQLRLVNKNTSLSTTCQTLQNIIVNIRGSASSVASSTSFGTNDEQKPSLLSGMIEEACDRELDQIDFPSVMSWTKKGWQEQFPTSTSAVPGASKKSARGSRRMAQGINVSTYLQDKNSMPVSAQRAKSIRSTMFSCFHQLHNQGLAPESIGQASLDILKWLVHMLRKSHIELCLCTDNWKIMKLMTDNYPQWHKHHIKNKNSNNVKAEAYEDVCLEEEESTSDVIPTTTQKRSSSEPDDEHATKRSRIDSDIGEEATQSNQPSNEMAASSCNEITRDPSPDHQSMPPPSTNKGKGKEVVVLEIKNLLSNLVIKPRPRPIPATSTYSSTSAGTLNPTIIPPSSMPEADSSADAASLATKVELVEANHAAEQTKTMITIDSKCDTIKKRQPSTKPMRVGAKITPQNLCALEWQLNGHQREPANIFATYWNGLSKADKEVYKSKAAAQLTSSGQAQGNDDNHDD
ncbi:hypothetical protein EV702DRAFT_1043681 [Suillus placidus]|uniref:Uncharacterized protein n=1 Tax=Suillus placidus TaxID=48579 RepID=A0A9P6ZZQ3_9AGAM|nr:hypothetical protein EV702DRAFT_1043681 [Suillus placidus]